MAGRAPRTLTLPQQGQHQPQGRIKCRILIIEARFHEGIADELAAGAIAELEARIAEQAKILDAALGFLRPGGRLVYVTCSVFGEENESQIGALLARHGGLAPLDHAALWEKHFPGHQTAARTDPGRGISLSPLKSGTDGFYVAALARTA